MGSKQTGAAKNKKKQMQTRIIKIKGEKLKVIRND